ncbi:hypothetical protein MMC13_006600 [Lambiella insularis]|nr:hypothetical protein [Lambiella insularis]
MQYNSDSQGRRGASGVNPGAAPFVSALSIPSVRSVSSPSTARAATPNPTSSQNDTLSTIRRSLTPGPPGKLSTGGVALIPSPLPSALNMPAYKPYQTTESKPYQIIDSSPFNTNSPVIGATVNVLKTPPQQQQALLPKSVKHLTCFYWRRYGKCNKRDDMCLYSHSDTGQYADEPQHREPGLPAVAGRNARLHNPVYQNWRSGSPAASTSSHRSSFSSHPLGRGQEELFSSPTLDSAPHYNGMALTPMKAVSYEQHQRHVQALRDIIGLQSHMAQSSLDQFVSMGRSVKEYRKILEDSMASDGSSQRSKQSPNDTLLALTRKLLAMEREAEVAAERLKVMKLDVDRGLERLVPGGSL